MALGKKKNNTDEFQLTEEELKAAQKYTNLAEKYYIEERDWNSLTKKERKQRIKEIKEKRKELKKDLKLQGITKKADFEFFATEMGLTYPEESNEARWAGFLAWLSGIWRWLMLNMTLARALLAALILLAATFFIAYIAEQRGHFTVNISNEMLKDGYQLSETNDFEEYMTRLHAQEIENSNATSITEINRSVLNKNGNNNGPGYMCYTFYLRSTDVEPSDYTYKLNILAESKNTADAAWVLFCEDDDGDGVYSQKIYAAPYVDERGALKPEALEGFDTIHFLEGSVPDSYNSPEEESERGGNKEASHFTNQVISPDGQYYIYNVTDRSGKPVLDSDGKNVTAAGIKTEPFLDDFTVLEGKVHGLENTDVKRYTVLVWLEGNDPDCNNSILGGHVGFNIQFERLDPEDETEAEPGKLFKRTNKEK